MGASFDCKKARSTAEIIICENKDLSEADDALAQIYYVAKEYAPDKQKFSEETKLAWKWREQNCRDADCLHDWYIRRGLELMKYVPQPTESGQQKNSLENPVIGASSSANDSSKSQKNTNPPIESSWFKDNILIIIVGGVVFLGLAAAVYGSRCPSCGKFFADKLESKDLVSKRIEHKTITRIDEHRDSHGKTTGTTRRKEQVAVEIREFKLSYKCKYCGHYWFKSDTETKVL